MLSKHVGKCVRVALGVPRLKDGVDFVPIYIKGFSGESANKGTHS